MPEAPWHDGRARGGHPPAVSTIWRILSRRGFVTPQPQKRPRSSFVRFEAAQPNERWQADITHWAGMHTPIEYEKLHTYPTAVA